MKVVYDHVKLIGGGVETEWGWLLGKCGLQGFYPIPPDAVLSFFEVKLRRRFIRELGALPYFQVTGLWSDEKLALV